MAIIITEEREGGDKGIKKKMEESRKGIGKDDTLSLYVDTLIKQRHFWLWFTSGFFFLVF